MEIDKCWPHNLYNAVFGKPIDLPESWEEDLSEVLSTLKERDRYLIERRYKYGGTLQDIGEEMRFSREHARRLIDNILRGFRRDDIALTLAYGKERFLSAKRKRREGEKSGFLVKVAEKYGEWSLEYEEAVQNFRPNRITDYNLSLRTVNCLTGEGYEFLDELLPYDEDKLLRIRSFGELCLQEVKALLVELELMKEADYEPKFVAKNGEAIQPEQKWPRNVIEKAFTQSELAGKTIFEASVESAIRTLPKTQRKILKARYRDGLSREEASELCSVTESTLRSYERHAIKQLRTEARRNTIFYGQREIPDKGGV